MCKYTDANVREIFERTNISCFALSEILGIPEKTVRDYIERGRRVLPTFSITLDAALDVLKDTRLKRPSWSIWFYYTNDTLTYKAMKRRWDDKFKRLVEEKEAKMTQSMVDNLLLIISAPDDANEFYMSEDPLKECGLDSYGLDAFVRRYDRCAVLS